MLGGVGLRGQSRRSRTARGQGSTTFAAELLPRRIGRSAAAADGGKPSPALAAELLARGVLVVAARASHRRARSPGSRSGGSGGRAGRDGARRFFAMAGGHGSRLGGRGHTPSSAL